MTPRLSRVERLAIELRHMECEDAAYPNPYTCSRERSWGISDILRNGYREQARRILKLVDGWKVDDSPSLEDTPE